jgi:hypothetical protein
VDAVEVDAVRVRAVVLEADPHPIALGDPDRRARHPAVVGPGREEEARGDLDFLVLGDDPKLAHGAAVRVLPQRARIPIGEECVRVEAVAGMVDFADGHHVAVNRVRFLRAMHAMSVRRGRRLTPSEKQGGAAEQARSEKRAPAPAKRGEHRHNSSTIPRRHDGIKS